MKKILLFIAVVSFSYLLKAQPVFDYGRAADNYFKKGDYTSASEYYEKYLIGLKKNPKEDKVSTPYSVTSVKMTNTKMAVVSTKEQATYNLAESYRLQHLHIKAEPFYAQATNYKAPAPVFPLSRYWQAKSLRALGNYSAADSTFKLFLKEYTGSDSITKDAAKEIANLEYIQKQVIKKDLPLYTVNKSGKGLNTEGGSSAPAFTGKEIFFTSTRLDSAAGKKDKTHINRIYKASFSDTGAAGVEKVNIQQSPGMHQGSVAFFPNGNALILTRGTIKGHDKTEALYYSSKTATGWSDLKILDSIINMPGTNSKQPFLLSDGKTLLFVSNRKGGEGGYDIWSVKIDSTNSLSAPVNLGSLINTPGDDETPYYHDLSSTFVFSSNARIGMGGFDLYQSKSKGGFGNFKEPVNLGYPINSIKDDQYFASLGTEKNMLSSILFSSDRSSSCCLELFELHKKRAWKNITGTVVSCDGNQPLPGVTVTIVDTINNKTITSKTTGTDGTYSFSIEDFQPLKATASLEGYNGNAFSFTGPQDDEEERYTIPSFCLTKPVPVIPELNVPIVMSNVLYEYDKAVLKPESFPSLDSVVALMEHFPTLEIEIGGHTDGKGKDEYNQKLSEQRAKSCVNYLISKGIAKERLIAKGYGKSVEVAPNTNPDGTDNEEGRKLNRRTEFKVLKK